MSLNYWLKRIFYGRISKRLPDVLLIVNQKGIITWQNDKAVSTFGNIKGGYIEDYIDKGLETVDKSTSTRMPIVAGAYINGEETFVELNAKRNKNIYIITIRDISAMTNVISNEHQTSQFNREKNAMLVKLSNEIKSPINSIIGFSQALIDGLGGEMTEKQDKYIRIINKNSEDFMLFIDKLLEFSYTESTLYESDYQTFDVINFVQNIVRNNSEEISAKELTINYNFDELNKQTIYTDENALKIILQNILETSIKLTDTGSINIKLMNKSNIFDREVKENSLLQIQISDTGIGIAETEIAGIFDPYSQLQSKKNIVRSLALGSVIILAKRLSGTAWVESEVMKGSTFNVIIPIEKDYLK